MVKKKELPLVYIPLPISEGSEVPTENIWNIELKDIKAVNDNVKDNTDITVTATVVNPTNLTFVLSTWTILGGIDTGNDNGYLLNNSDVYSWSSENRTKIINPKTETKIKLCFRFDNPNKPTKFKLIIGSKFMPAFEQEIDIE